MRKITITRRVVVRSCIVRKPLPPRVKKPVTIRIGNVTKTIWV